MSSDFAQNRQRIGYYYKISMRYLTITNILYSAHQRGRNNISTIEARDDGVDNQRSFYPHNQSLELPPARNYFDESFAKDCKLFLSSYNMN